MRHPHADLIHAYAEGAEIEWYDGHRGIWRPADRNPEWSEITLYRIKPKKREWYEDIPPHGVLCWVKDDSQFEPIMDIIRSVCDGVYESVTDKWQQATPLTNEEIQKFLRSET
jgi:hypothetical protein